MDKTKLQEIANQYNLNEIFVDFMRERFPNESDIYYIQEWAKRFKTGYVHVYMDKKSLDIYIRLMRDWNK